MLFRVLCHLNTPESTGFLRGVIARTLPRLTIDAVRVEALPGDAALRRITARIRNDGFLPTNISKQALLTKVARPVEVALSLEGATLVDGPLRQSLGHLPGRSVDEGPAWHAPEATASSATARWIVRLDSDTAHADITARSPKAGVARESLSLGG